MIIKIISNEIEGWKEVCKLYKRIENLNSPKRIIFDFFDIDVLGLSAIMNLIILNRYIFEKFKLNIIIINLRIDIYQKLSKCNFFEITGINVKSNSIMDELRDLPENNNYKRFKRFDINSIRLYVVENSADQKKVYKVLKELLDIWFPEKEFRKYINQVLTLIGEVSLNSIEHSENIPNTGKSYILIEKKSVDFNNTETSIYDELNFNEYQVVISISDIGIGIKNRLEEKYRKKYMNNFEYISFALENGITGRTKEVYPYHTEDNGGNGLSLVQSVINNFNGSMKFRSSGGLIEDNNKIDLDYRIPGTQIEIILSNSKRLTLVD